MKTALIVSICVLLTSCGPTVKIVEIGPMVCARNTQITDVVFDCPTAVKLELAGGNGSVGNLGIEFELNDGSPSPYPLFLRETFDYPGDGTQTVTAEGRRLIPESCAAGTYKASEVQAFLYSSSGPDILADTTVDAMDLVVTCP